MKSYFRRGLAALTFLLAGTALAQADEQTVTTWTRCAQENATCKFTGAKLVKFGTSARFNTKTATGPVPCTVAQFGQPAKGYAKACWVGTDAPVVVPPVVVPPVDPAPSQPTTGSGATVILRATRASGPAPLAVLFDASGTTATGVEFPFHKLTYAFDFGDAASGTYAITGLSKNTQVGAPLAAHVFERPGTYSIQVRVTGPGNVSGNATVRVTVTDPAEAYAGNKTVCVSTSRTFTGCPAGATQATAVPAPLTGKRVLLRRGESFGRLSPANTDNDFQVGTFGTGAKPIVAGIATGGPTASGGVPNDWSVTDLQINGCVNLDAPTVRFLMLRNDINHWNASCLEAMVNIGTAAQYYGDRSRIPNTPWPREVFLVENDIKGVVSSSRSGAPNITLMGWFNQSALLGNSMDRAYEHTVRIWSARKTVLAHNHMGGNHYPGPGADAIGIRAALKLHAAGTQAWSDTVGAAPGPVTDQFVLADNRIGSPTYPGSWVSGFSPQNSDPGTIEGLQDCIAERNIYTRGAIPGTRTYLVDLMLRGRRMTSRENRLTTGAPAVVVNNNGTFDPGMASWNGPYWITN